MEPNHLEEEYQRLLRSLFDKLREDVEYGEITRDNYAQLRMMLQERLGVSDPNPNDQPWERSSWCGDNDSWDSSGCSF